MSPSRSIYKQRARRAIRLNFLAFFETGCPERPLYSFTETPELICGGLLRSIAEEDLVLTQRSLEYEQHHAT
jgi:hypothetical protein